MEAEPGLPNRTKKATFNILTHSVTEWAEEQTKNLQRIRTRAEELQQKENQAKAQICKNVRRVNEQKQIILTSELLKNIHYGDMDVTHRMLTGFPLVGTMTEAAVFERRLPRDILAGADTIWLARTQRQPEPTSPNKS